MAWHKRLFFLLLCLLPTQLGYHMWPSWSMVLGRRIDYLSPTLYLTDLIIFSMIGVWIAEEFQKTRKPFYISAYIKKPVVWFGILAVVYAVVNIISAIRPQVSVYAWIKVLEYSLLFWYIVHTKPARTFVVYGLSIAIFYSSVLAVAQFILQGSVGGPLWWLGERTFTISTPGIARMTLCGRTLLSCQLIMRPYATFPHPNVLGGFLAVTLPFVYAFIAQQKIVIKNHLVFARPFFWAVFAFGVLALLLTMSRSAVLVGSVVLLWMGITRMRREYLGILSVRQTKKSLWLIPRKYVVLVLVFFTCAVFGVMNIKRIIPADESLMIRQQLNVAAVSIWRTSPLFGVGLGNFVIKLSGVYAMRSVYVLQPVHNIYLLIVSEIGLVGCLVFALFAYALYSSYHVKHTTVGFPAVYALGMLLVLGLVDHYPLTLQQGQILLTVLLAFSCV